MASEDTVTVQALTTYMEGHEHKNERSAPYRVTRAHAVDLTANGFARTLDGSAVGDDVPDSAEEQAAEDGRGDLATEGKIENNGKPRGRRAFARD